MELEPKFLASVLLDRRSGDWDLAAKRLEMLPEIRVTGTHWVTWRRGLIHSKRRRRERHPKKTSRENSQEITQWQEAIRVASWQNVYPGKGHWQTIQQATAKRDQSVKRHSREWQSWEQTLEALPKKRSRLLSRREFQCTLRRKPSRKKKDSMIPCLLTKSKVLWKRLRVFTLTRLTPLSAQGLLVSTAIHATVARVPTSIVTTKDQ